MPKLNLDNMHSPCVHCYQHLNHQYDENSQMCQGCEYNIAIQLLKTVLRLDNYCCICKNRTKLGGGYWGCKKDLVAKCEIQDFDIDWKEAFSEYDIKV